jgi:predicted enzyme related to lactoylglutathione lyase
MDAIRTKEEKKNVITAVPFLQVRDIQKSIDFYERQLGFEISETWEPEGKVEWCHLRKDGGEIMLQQFKPYHSIHSKQSMSIYFSCVDALVVFRDIGYRKSKPTEPVVSNGKWVTRVIDPDGYEINFESLANAPEGTSLSQWSD